ncbi:adenosylmethionine-8-amino-7-oxononanoate aminotransferase [mine drainage metagenome]|uniref:Adenosylmethionine-8-amino-7-oxononanoate aminotransferase n=1 Tax=mine drainage metagenome TaxID=410659 RepID=A0A1J5PMN6_9ZZZZ
MATTGQYFEDRLRQLAHLPLVGEVRGRKFMICVENVADKSTKRLLPEALDVGRRVTETCEAAGLVVRPLGHLNVMSPPLTMTRSDVDFVAETLEKAIVKVTDDLVRDGVRIG